jgi:plastocyanin
MWNRVKRIQGILFVLGLGAALMAGCSSDNGYGSNNGGNNGGGNPGPDEVWMQNTAFNPSTITVDAGTTITWTNKDNMTHTATSGTPGNPDGIFNSGNMGQNATFSFTFNTAGTYSYYCMPHSSTMHGTVVAQ